MTIDYSPEDLEQLLSVSTENEYMSSLFSLHENFKSIIDQFENFSTDQNEGAIALLDEIKLSIAENQLSIQGHLKKQPNDIMTDSTLPPLFNDLESKHLDDTFSKNFVQYHSAIELLNTSYSKLDGSNKDINISHATFKVSCEGWLDKLSKKSKTKEVAKKEEPKKEVPKKEVAKKEEPKKEVAKKEEPKKEEPKKEEPKKEEPKKEEPKKEEPKKEAIVDEVERQDDYTDIANISDTVSKNLAHFMENYNKLHDGRKTVNDCISQLSAFASKGLQVESALEPLNKQLKSFGDLQSEYLTKLLKVSQEFDSVIKEMHSVTENTLLKL
jgi:hypothetical protein